MIEKQETKNSVMYKSEEDPEFLKRAESLDPFFPPYNVYSRDSTFAASIRAVNKKIKPKHISSLSVASTYEAIADHVIFRHRFRKTKWEGNWKIRGGWTNESFNYFPSEREIYVARTDFNSCLEHSKRLHIRHRGGKDFLLPKDEAEKIKNAAEEDGNLEPQEKRVLKTSKNGSYFVPSNRLHEDELALFLFKDLTSLYADRISSLGQEGINVDIYNPSYVSLQKRPFASPLFFGEYCWVEKAKGIHIDGASELFKVNDRRNGHTFIKSIRKRREERILLETELENGEISKWIEKLDNLKELENGECVHLETKKGKVTVYHKKPVDCLEKNINLES